MFNRLISRPDGQGGAVTEVGGFDLVGENHHPTIVVKTYLPTDAADTPEVQRQVEEGLWYLGLVQRAFATWSSGQVEMAFVPAELRLYMPAPAPLDVSPPSPAALPGGHRT